VAIERIGPAAASAADVELGKVERAATNHAADIIASLQILTPILRIVRTREEITFTFVNGRPRATTEGSPLRSYLYDKWAIIVGAGLRTRPEMEKLFNPHS
jgi:hypothetical protein